MISEFEEFKRVQKLLEDAKGNAPRRVKEDKQPPTEEELNKLMDDLEQFTPGIKSQLGPIIESVPISRSKPKVEDIQEDEDCIEDPTDLFKGSKKFNQILCSAFSDLETPIDGDVIRNGSQDEIFEELKKDPCTAYVMNLTEDLLDAIEEKNKLEDKILEVRESFDDEFEERERYLGRLSAIQNVIDEVPIQFKEDAITDSEFEEISEVYEDASEITDFISKSNSEFSEEFHTAIDKELVDKIKDVFGVDVLEEEFTRMDVDYEDKRDHLFSRIDEELETAREKWLKTYFNTGVSEIFNEVNVPNANINQIQSSTQNNFTSFLQSGAQDKFESLEEKLEREVELEEKISEIRDKLERFECVNNSPQLKDSAPQKEQISVDELNRPSEDENIAVSPYIMSGGGSDGSGDTSGGSDGSGDTSGDPDPTKLDYWRQFSRIATIVNLINPIQHWPIGLLIPTPAKIVRVPMPIIWIPIVVIPVLDFLIVVFIGQCGVVPSPFVLFLDFSSKSADFIVSLRGSHTIRSSNQLDSNVIETPTVQSSFGEWVINSDLQAALPLIQDDIPDFSRLSLTNIPWSFGLASIGFLLVFNQRGKDGGGFFRDM